MKKKILKKELKKVKKEYKSAIKCIKILKSTNDVLLQEYLDNLKKYNEN